MGRGAAAHHLTISTRRMVNRAFRAACPTCGGARSTGCRWRPRWECPMAGRRWECRRPPGGLVQPGLDGQSVFPYSAQTPDVTMVPTTTAGPLPERSGWVQRYEFGVMPFSQVKDGGDRFGEWAFDLGWKYVAPLYPIPAIVLLRAAVRPAALDRSVAAPGTYPDQPAGLAQPHRLGLRAENGHPRPVERRRRPSIPRSTATFRRA